MSLSGEFFAENRRRLLDALPGNSLAVFFAGEYRQRSEDDMYSFTPNRNYYYLTGLKNIGGVLLLVKSGSEQSACLFTERPTPRRILYKGPFPSQEEYACRTGISRVFYLDELPATVDGLLLRHGCTTLYGDYVHYRMDGVGQSLERFTRRMREAYPGMQICSVRPILCNMRRVKTPEEQELLRRAGAMTAEAVCDLVGQIRPGMWTYSLYSRFAYFLGYHYGEGPSFQSVITTGEDCLALHCFETFGQLQEGGLVLVDAGAECEYYASDICRMYPVSGRFTQEQRYFYQSVIDAEAAVERLLRPGFPMGEIAAAADAVLFERLRQAGLVSRPEEVRRYLSHGIYHFVGLDAHDVGDECVLEAGMVVSVEPGLYIPEKKIGVRVEDNFLITDGGCVNLTEKLPKLPHEIEAQMKENMQA